ncbi:MAG: hypothetical protein ABI164_03875 [Acidobacteriaceae bacterium]
MTAPFVHDDWQEVYLISSLIDGSDENSDGGERFGLDTDACRPPGMSHGLFKSESGCILMEIQMYDRGERSR